MEDIIIKYLNQTATENEMRALLEWLDENIDNQRQFAITRDLWFASEASVSSRYGESANAFSRFRENALAFENRKSKNGISIRLVKIAASIA